MNMRGTPGIDGIAPGIGAWLDRVKMVTPFGIGNRAATAPEVRIDRREIGVPLVSVATTRIRLPDLDECCWYWSVGLVQHTTVHDNAFANWIAGFGVIANEIAVERPDFVMSKHRPRYFG